MQTPKEQELFKEYAQTKELALRNKLALSNVKLVSFVINKFYNKKPEHKALREDLLQEGKIGLLNAIERFKPELGNQFSTYAILWIKQSISSYLLGQQSLIHVPSNVKIMQNKVLRKLNMENMDLKDFTEEGNNIQEIFQISKKDIRTVQNSLKSRHVMSIETPVDQNTTLKDTLKNSLESHSDVLTDSTTLVSAVMRGLKELTEREKYVLLLRYHVIDDLPEGAKHHGQ